MMGTTKYQTRLATISSNGFVVSPEASSSGSGANLGVDQVVAPIRFSIEFRYLDYGVAHHREYHQHLMPGIRSHDRWATLQQNTWAHRSHSNGSSNRLPTAATTSW
jgi:hypothetical protein